MPNLIDKEQLQATAQVAKSYILDQDTANVNTIINALQQSGGGGSGKQIPTLAFTNADTVFPSESAADMGYKPTVTAQISYDGDGTIYTTQPDYLHSLASGDQITWTASGSRAAYVLYAKETNNYAAAVLIY